MTAAERLDAIEARAKGATEGPWLAMLRSVIADGPYAEWSTVADSEQQKDVEFIAHARQDIPALIAALRAVLAVLADAYAEDGILLVEALEVRDAITATLDGAA
jgi:hypothetical protein